MPTEDRSPNAEFTALTQPHRRELLAYCYRMLGSHDDAEDLVQEIYLRAWRGYGGFEARSSVRTWLYRIATNACLTALAHRSRRVLPSGLDTASANPYATPDSADTRTEWLGPLPDALVTPASDDPAAVAVTRDSLRLALIAMLQQLSGRQRAVLILRDVLDFPAAEVADLLGTSTAAVKSTLQRARARLDGLADIAARRNEPTDPRGRALLDEYIAAFESADAARLERILHRDAVIEMPPSRTWFSGKRTCVAYLANQVLGVPGTWRMLPTTVNGQPAAAAYLRDDRGDYVAFGIGVLTTESGEITRITVFGDPELVRRCGFPANDPASRSRRTAQG
ncbi:RNA polymerase sigma-70 factor (ECF subfamily) [Nocardia transvalensis]|uniref:RNA polymerase sigma-70 factor (ECF subfamily) n=1 Tax=Nocardia transvalensis TaxID=37333 RepID=A0A7W9PH51_9NOCA|nr:sigma-70 family RNA polymerase sigma factor [Nocardia transvalensis]MBB5915980.1 RNA polymerase sigma-70 factor (ECF subfamily) [Nocardia transvalensis]